MPKESSEQRSDERMKCPDCGSEMLPTGAMFAGHPCVACPKCSPDFIKQKVPKVIILDNNPLSIASYLEEFGDKREEKFVGKLSKDAVKIEGLFCKGHVITSKKGVINKIKYYILGYALIVDEGYLIDETKKNQ